MHGLLLHPPIPPKNYRRGTVAAAERKVHGATDWWQAPTDGDASKCLETFLETGIMHFLPSRAGGSGPTKQSPMYHNHGGRTWEPSDKERLHFSGVPGFARHGMSPATRQMAFRAYPQAHNLWIETGVTPPPSSRPRSAYGAHIERGMRSESDREFDNAWARARAIAAIESEQLERQQHRGGVHNGSDEYRRWRQYQLYHQLWVQTEVTPDSSNVPTLLPQHLPVPPQRQRVCILDVCMCVCVCA